MEYAIMKNIKENISRFGLGCMRFTLKEGTEEVLEEQAIAQIRYAIDNGVNYIDTAYNYHGGNSEIIVGKALKDGYREKVTLTTKSPVWKMETPEDFDKTLDEQLEKLGVSHIDIYLLHAQNKTFFEKAKKLEVFKFIERAKALGKIKYIGFSFHDELPVFKEIIDSYNWDVCQIQLNLLDINYQAGLEGMKYASEKNIPVIVMEPLKGGTLVKNISDDIKNVYKNFDANIEPIEWLFRWVGNFPEVLTILSGTNNIEQTAQNIKIFEKVKADSLTDDELKFLDSVRDKYNEKIKIGCTSCKYCMPCPMEVNIPSVFGTYNNSAMFDYETSKKSYKTLEEQGHGSDKCIECGQCESLCPQNLEIIEGLKAAQEHFA